MPIPKNNAPLKQAELQFVFVC